MKITGTIALFLAFLCVAAIEADGAESQKKEPDVKSLLRDRVEGEKSATCIVAGTIDETGQHIFSFGKLTRSATQSADGDTVFEIGSATKVFTGLLLADAVEHKEVKLDDPVAKFLPKTVTMPSGKDRQIRLLDLATQSSGLPRLPDNIAPKDVANPYADYTPEKLYSFLSGYHLQREIGSQYEYSNLGVGLLGHALSLQSHLDYETLIVKKIATPLRMNSTRITLTPELKARLAQGHNIDGEPVANWDMAVLAGAGGVRSTANDLLKFLAANLNLHKSELFPAMELSHQPRRNAGSPNMDIGLCWHIIKSPAGNVVWHNGETGGYHSFIAIDPHKKRGVVVLANSGASIDDLALHILDPANPLLPTKSSIELAPAILNRYVGKYELAPGAVFEIRRNEKQLQAQLTGQPFFSIFPKSETEFFYKVVDAQISFTKDAKGDVTSLTLHQNGRDLTAKRLPN